MAPTPSSSTVWACVWEGVGTWGSTGWSPERSNDKHFLSTHLVLKALHCYIQQFQQFAGFSTLCMYNIYIWLFNIIYLLFIYLSISDLSLFLTHSLQLEHCHTASDHHWTWVGRSKDNNFRTMKFSRIVRKNGMKMIWNKLLWKDASPSSSEYIYIYACIDLFNYACVYYIYMYIYIYVYIHMYIICTYTLIHLYAYIIYPYKTYPEAQWFTNLNFHFKAKTYLEDPCISSEFRP